MGWFETAIDTVDEWSTGVGDSLKPIAENLGAGNAIDAATDGNFLTDAFSYINENEWAANLLAGAATGAANYMVAQDANDAKERLLEKQKKLSMVEYGGGGKNYANMKNGLLAGGRPSVRDFSRSR